MLHILIYMILLCTVKVTECDNDHMTVEIQPHFDTTFEGEADIAGQGSEPECVFDDDDNGLLKITQLDYYDCGGATDIYEVCNIFVLNMHF